MLWAFWHLSEHSSLHGLASTILRKSLKNHLTQMHKWQQAIPPPCVGEGGPPNLPKFKQFYLCTPLAKIWHWITWEGGGGCPKGPNFRLCNLWTAPYRGGGHGGPSGPLSFFFLSFCLLVILSFCHFVILSFCHFVILSFCHFVILSFCLLVFLSFCLFVFLSFCIFVY